MKLLLNSPYRSLLKLPETRLPDFTLITGPNGSGKTHLLEAIAQGYIAVEGPSIPKEEIALFDWSNLVPKQAADCATDDLYRDWKSLVASARESRENYRSHLELWKRKYRLDRAAPALEELLRSSPAELSLLVGGTRRRSTGWTRCFGRANCQRGEAVLGWRGIKGQAHFRVRRQHTGDRE